MNLSEYLQKCSSEILEEATLAMERARLKHYERDGKEHVHARLKALLVLCIRGVKERNLGPMLAHADEVARERFNAGFDLWEIQTAFNVLEEAIWKRIVKDFPPEEYAEALGLVGTILGSGKDTLARRYVSLASKSRVPTLDMKSLFSGSEHP
jgi:hypothetical protein